MPSSVRSSNETLSSRQQTLSRARNKWYEYPLLWLLFTVTVVVVVVVVVVAAAVLVVFLLVFGLALS